MWHFVQPHAPVLPDTQRFLDALYEQRSFFAPDRPLHVGRAPGRLDLMGGIADYSGSLVLELPLSVATWVAVQATDEPEITLLSTSIDAGSGAPLVSVPTSALVIDHQALGYTEVHELLTATASSAWAAYVAGVLILLRSKHDLPLEGGLRFFIYSEVPVGKGVSSSAAIEVAAMQALAGLFELELDGREVALLCQQAENVIVGAPCGVMDQMTSACGIQNNLLALLCQPAEVQTGVALPPEVEVWGIDSGVRHAVTGADYGSVRVGAFMGYRMIAELAGLEVRQLGDGRVNVYDTHWQGYLANIPPSLWESAYCQHVPERITGASFLEQYGGFTDSITRIDPHSDYAVRQPTAHPIYEHHRVQLFRQLLAQPSVNQAQLILLGELMYQSHASYSACGLGSSGTDRLVELVREIGVEAGFYGAKITGGGSGGTVAVLTRRGSGEAVRYLAERYRQETGRDAEILHGSSPGALAWGRRQLVFSRE